VDRIARREETPEGSAVDPTLALGVAPRESASGRRLVLRRGSARAILSVDEVLDLVPLSPTDLAAVPPLIAAALPDRRIWAVGKKGDEILLLLDVATLCKTDAPAGSVAGSEEA
jgi:chemotaxis signal transduction protein